MVSKVQVCSAGVKMDCDSGSLLGKLELSVKLSVNSRVHAQSTGFMGSEEVFVSPHFLLTLV